MPEPLFEVTSEYELIALDRVLMEAKFSGHAGDQDVPASKLVADVATRVASRLRSMRPESAPTLAIDPSRREWSAALVHTVSQRAWWCSAAPDRRVVYIELLMAPFQIDRTMARRFEAEADGILREGRWYSVWRKVEGHSVRLVTKRPDVERSGYVVVGADGAIELQRASDEGVVTEWLVENGFEFVLHGILPSR